MAKFGSNRLSLIDSTTLTTYQKPDGFSTAHGRFFGRSNFRAFPIVTSNPHLALAISELRNLRIPGTHTA